MQGIFCLLFYLYSYGVVQGKQTTKDPLNDTITIKVKQAKNKRSLARHHNYKGKTSKPQKIP
jgi:uncharacterized protein involved in tellurium resistance